MNFILLIIHKVKISMIAQNIFSIFFKNPNYHFSKKIKNILKIFFEHKFYDCSKIFF